MKKSSQIISVIFFALITITPTAYSEEKPAHHEAHAEHGEKQVTGVKALSPELRKLLSKEMQALQQGMKDVIPAYISGQWEEIALIGHKMKASYILKQSLSNEQMQELHGKLPASFIKLDQQFHYLAGMLNHAATNKKPELVGFYFSELSKSCVECHSQFATHRFPALGSKQEGDDHSH